MCLYPTPIHLAYLVYLAYLTYLTPRFPSVSMSLSRNNDFPHTNNPPSPPITLRPPSPTPSLTPPSSTSPSSPLCSQTTDTDLCTICHDKWASILDRATVPACNHTFCVNCLLSWATVRGLCPNCKAPFSHLFIHRDHFGQPVSGPPTATQQPPFLLLSSVLLCHLPWIQLSHIHSAKHDIEASFDLPRPQPQLTSSPSSAPEYNSEDVEDEMEDRFWQEEETQYNRLMRSSRVISNRRFGPQGYISSGHMRATPRPIPCPTPHPAPRLRKLLGDTSSASQQSFSSSASGSGSRKKKVKKKSRAGIAAAEAAARAAPPNHSQQSSVINREVAASTTHDAVAQSLSPHVADASSSSAAHAGASSLS